ncbi:MerR family transcriptional regulator [Saccharothrix australiensis]|uniref:MerR-like DNA binding protein n=1 Tax=Saccharothrix australiensis TaxID=2072 RepID=A0A495W3C2_9PSEU|nr:MerR family transcriptional regulator [Saccharothrix australiensis]RKT55183.1 MerR-like DNA binding protein [Saccharothrix australiensis]
MRIAELSRRSGVSVPTIKFYLREGLLSPGTRTGRNQAGYDETHERRLRLVRALVEVGGLSIAAVREVLRAVDAPVAAVPALLGRVRRQPSAPPGGADDPLSGWADVEVARLITRRGWAVGPDHPAARALADVLATAERLGHEGFPAVVDKYAVACEGLAAVEMESLAVRSLADGGGGAEERVEDVVVGTVLGDAAVTALRRLAQDDASRRVFGRADEVG